MTRKKWSIIAIVAASVIAIGNFVFAGVLPLYAFCGAIVVVAAVSLTRDRGNVSKNGA